LQAGSASAKAGIQVDRKAAIQRLRQINVALNPQVVSKFLRPLNPYSQ
jgi:hypothetical protein